MAQNESNSKTKIRFLVFHYIQQGHTYASASQIFLITLDSVQKWVARYKKYGIEGLQNKTIPGRPSLNDAKDNVKIL
ncbi:MAG: helix-turn-helix domain-containing protein, partial [Psychromonas sp.]|nr:helix-turn-helix domain-containing protein [Psychromonas sp.]